MIKSIFYSYKVLLAIFITIIFFVSTAVAAPPESSYGFALVDGNESEWNLTSDFFANMHVAANPANPIRSFLYLRYNSVTQTMYALVMAGTGKVVNVNAASTWITIDGIGNKVVNGNDNNDGIPPDFAWIDRGFDGNIAHARGWEASFSLAPGTYTIIAHNEIFDGVSLTSSTTDRVTSRAGIDLVVNDVFIPYPSIDVEKYLSESQTGPWLTTDGQPGHIVPPGTSIYFRFQITNSGNVSLSNVTLSDSDFTLNSCPVIPEPLHPGASYECIIGPHSATSGQHTNTATAEGQYEDVIYSKTDDANYYGTEVHAVLGDHVWHDMNANGIQDPGEGIIEGVDIELYKCDDTFVATSCTCEHGRYTFLVNPNESYYLKFIAPSGYSFSPRDQGSDDAIDSDADPATGRTRCIYASELEPGVEYRTWDAGVYLPAHLGGSVWNDNVVADGIYSPEEDGVAGVTVNLYTCSNSFISSKTTNTDGFYEFIDLVPGNYYLEFILPNNHIFTYQNQGLDEAADSEADMQTGKTACMALSSGQSDLTWHAGIINKSDPVQVVVMPDIQIVFSQINSLCESSATLINLASAPAPAPFGYTLISLYDITTCATYTGNIDVTVPYDPLKIRGAESGVRMFHFENGTWRDVTVSIDTVNNTVTGRVNSLSPFGIGFGSGYETGANTNVLIVIAILAVMTGLYLLRNQRLLQKS
jgi:hypothetical protein